MHDEQNQKIRPVGSQLRELQASSRADHRSEDTGLCSAYSRETQRRMSIIEEVFGPDWRSRYADHSISALYRQAMEDDREPVYALVSPEAKDMLWDLAARWEMSLAEAVEALIVEEFEATALE